MLNYVAISAIAIILLVFIGILISQFVGTGASSSSSYLGNLYNQYSGYPIAPDPSPTYQPYLKMPSNS